MEGGETAVGAVWCAARLLAVGGVVGCTGPAVLLPDGAGFDNVDATLISVGVVGRLRANLLRAALSCDVTRLRVSSGLGSLDDLEGRKKRENMLPFFRCSRDTWEEPGGGTDGAREGGIWEATDGVMEGAIDGAMDVRRREGSSPCPSCDDSRRSGVVAAGCAITSGRLK